MLASALAALLALAAPEPAPAPDAAVARALASPAGAARALAATRPLLGAPYVRSPLGEGAGRDPDPRFRLDAFDCMTFVETAVALGSARSLAEARAALDDVRYSGAPAWANRNHEVLSQWIPANVAKGWISAAPLAPPGADARRVEKDYTPATWEAVRAAGRAIPGLPRGRLPLGRFVAPLVSIEDASRVADRIPDGAVVFVVREDAPDRATLVTHAGLVVRGPGGAVRVRHATSTKGVERVIEEPLDRFLRRESRAYPRWPLAGLSFFAIGDASARVHTLSAAGTGRAGEAPAAYPPPEL